MKLIEDYDLEVFTPLCEPAKVESSMTASDPMSSASGVLTDRDGIVVKGRSFERSKTGG